MITCTAEPGSAAEDALNFLASWTTERDRPSGVEADYTSEPR
jgi:hypothetical protein